MTRLAALGLEVRRGGRPILRDASLTLEGGALVALLGPNGAGKSTLLACLAGLLAPDRGGVTLDGVPLARLGAKALARRRAYLPQGARAEWPVTVERLVGLGLTAHLPAFGELRPDQRVWVAEMLDRHDLAKRRNQPATTLSGGELARAMMARALVGEPEVLLADEPLAGLDPRHALDGIARLRALADTGILVVAALHDLTLAARYAHEVILMREGRLLAHGPTTAILTGKRVSELFGVAARISEAGTTEATVDLRRAAP